MNPWCDELLKFYTDMLNGISQPPWAKANTLSCHIM